MRGNRTWLAVEASLAPATVKQSACTSERPRQVVGDDQETQRGESSETSKSSRPPRRHLPDAELLTVDDVAAFHGRRPAAIRKRINQGKECPGWHKPGKEWVVRKRTYERWLDKQEQLAT